MLAVPASGAAEKLQNAELLTTQLGGVRLRLELDRARLWRGDHGGVKQLTDDMARYLYLPRLRDATDRGHWVQRTVLMRSR